MTATYDDYTGNNSNKNFTYNFPALLSTDIKVSVDGVTQTSGYTVNTANTRVEFTTAPAQDAKVRVYRDTAVGKTSGDEDPKAVFAAGSSVRAADLNNNFEQLLFAAHERQEQPILAEDLDTGAVTSVKILDGTIVDADVNASAQIAVNKLADGSARQVLQTASNGSDVEWTSNVSVPGTLEVTSTTLLTGDATLVGNTTVFPASGQTKEFKVKNDSGTDKFTVNSATGNTTVAGTLDVDGNTTLDGTSVDGTLGVTGLSTLASVDINGGAIDGTTIGANSAAAGTFTTINASGTITGNITGEVTGNAATATDLAAAAKITNSEQGSHTSNDTTYFTTSASDARYYNIGTTEEIVSGESWVGDDAKVATTKAIDNRIVDILDDVGGFIPITDEGELPQYHPEKENVTTSDRVGTILSIGTLTTTYTPSTGTCTIQASDLTNHSVNATITDCGSTVLSAGFGVLVETKAQTDGQYAAGPSFKFHRLVPKATEVTTVAGKATEITTCHTNISNINAVASDISDINAVAADATDIGAVAAKATEIGRLGTADAVADLALLGTTAVVEDLNLLGTSAAVADMALLGDSAVIADMATIADTSNLITNIGTVAGIQANVTTVATNNSNVTTVATNISDVNNFADLYQIASSNPSTDGGGNSLAEGDLYFNTSADELKVWNGSSWQGGVTATGSFAAVTGNTFTGDNKYNDGVKLLLGSGSDLEVYHDATNSWIDNSTGNLLIRDNTGNIYLQSPVVSLQGGTSESNKQTAKFTAGGSVELYYDDSKKFETSSTGGILSGTLWTALDNTKIAFGTNDDLQIYHDATNSYLANTTGNLIIKDTTGTIYLQSTRIDFESEDGEQIAHFISDGAVELYYDNAKKFETRSDGVEIYDHLYMDDNHTIVLGNDSDMQLWHTGTHGYIYNTTGWGILRSDNWQITDKEASDVMANFKHDGAVELFYDNSKKFNTHTSGIQLDNTGGTSGTGTALFGNSGMPYIQGLDSGNHGSNSGIFLYSGSGDSFIKCKHDGNVELYYDNSKKLETISAGAKVTGDFQFQGTSAQWDDSESALTFVDNYKIKFGASDDLEIYHNGTHTYIDNNTGNLYIDVVAGSNLINRTNEWQVTNAAESEYIMRGTANGASRLFYDGVEKLATSSAGVSFSGDTFMPDGESAHYGTGNDMYMGHSGSYSYIEDTSGDLRIHSNGIKLQSYTSGEKYITAAYNGAVELYYDNDKKFETVSYGTITSGESRANNFQVLDYNGSTVGLMKFGAGDDLKIYHDGSHSYLANTTGVLHLTNTSDIKLQVGSGANELAIDCNSNGSVELYYDSNKTIETASTGTTVAQGYDIRFTSGNWTGDTTTPKIQGHANYLYVCGGTAGIVFRENASNRALFDGNGHFIPGSNNTYDLGSPTDRWRNIYTNDLNLSNEGSTNDVDGTWGNFTIQEGEDDLFLINKRNGKKYKFNLTEVN